MKNAFNLGIKITILILVLSLCACSHSPTKNKDSAPKHDAVDVSKIPDAVPKLEARSKYGNKPYYVVLGKKYAVQDTPHGHKQRGKASWYGTQFHGRKTSNGEVYNMYEMTAAHKNLPLPSYARVTNLDNGKQVIVRVNDRGPFHGGRIIDLSYAAARKLGVFQKGTANVEVETIRPEKLLLADNDKKSEPRINQDAGVFLQVGAFNKKGTAEKLAKDLRHIATHPVHVASTQNKGSALYRVRIGPIPNKEIAQNLTSKLISSKLATKSMIVGG